jgi:hypothetical protein
MTRIVLRRMEAILNPIADFAVVGKLLIFFEIDIRGFAFNASAISDEARLSTFKKEGPSSESWT